MVLFAFLCVNVCLSQCVVRVGVGMFLLVNRIISVCVSVVFDMRNVLRIIFVHWVYYL